MTSPTPDVAPGASGRRPRRPRIDWELIGCGLHGHHLVGTESARIAAGDHVLVREIGALRWHRCLRCDAWIPLAVPERPSRPEVPTRDEIEVPLRGAALRDRYVLRVIAVERVLHIIVLGLLVAAIFVFAAHQRTLHGDYTRLLGDLQGAFGGTTGRHGILADINKLFSISTADLYLIGAGLAAYTAVLALETVGLWYDRRWAEYLTFVETSVLVPYEVYELARGVSALKVLTLVINLTILVYLSFGHRLFGLRGGLAGLEARRAASNGWDAIELATPASPSWPAASGSVRSGTAQSEQAGPVELEAEGLHDLPGLRGTHAADGSDSSDEVEELGPRLGRQQHQDVVASGHDGDDVGLG
jgi:uncharacterized membrane protein (DUF2068 family)